ncbi:putative tricarboxylic transport membrane protein [Caldanaerovirga acetigignens]|uniref:Putative tricarboxylic transport membrane protein n=1 Tax=Caldanaerovirga acetigignens TaxID=447595 RepID=A0A1M7I8J2_9FIRM|nr:tripartite tricarboxylate transporter permease [Caldanaerovirga acetigignens]SHM36863.1 putative tricarboxylic transport membrane protein [Caldanaerovirga acetigignens]
MSFLLLLIYMTVGAIIGLFMGALPGLTVTMTIALVVSLTFGWPMVDALAFIIGAFCGGVMGGSISAITLNIPGTAAAVATIFDGFPLKQKGEAANALSLALFVSLLGGFFGIIFLAVLGPLLGSIALKFGNQEYFLICLWGITLVAVLSKENLLKGLAAASLGFLISMIGMDPITGLMRFTFGSKILSGGINYIVAMIGLFGMKEVFVQLSNKRAFKVDDFTYRIRDLFPKLDIVKKSIVTYLWSAPIGAIIGLLPGTGGDIASLVSYGVSKQIIKKPSRPFGEGAYEGIAAPEIANDAAIGGAITTLLTLGIPGDSVTAIMLGSFYLHGLLPGPTFMMTEKKYFYMILVFLAISIFIAYFVGIFGSNIMLKMLNLPKWVLLPFISILCIVGSYSLQNNINDVIFMIMFGLIGYVLEKAGYPVSPIVLAIILGPMIETNFRKALISAGGFGNVIISFFTRPISLILLVLIVLTYVAQSKVMKLEQQ